MVPDPVKRSDAGSLTANRRNSDRLPATYNATVCDTNGEVLAKGQTSNISDGGVFVVATSRNGLAIADRLILQLELSDSRSRPRSRTTKMKYLVRLVRVRSIGHLYGLGLQFLDRLE